MSSAKESSIVTSGRREAAVALLLWLAAMSYSVWYCTTYGYYRTAEELTFVLGFPSWVFWGVIAPWSVCTAITWWYAFVFMTDEDLEAAADAPTGDGDAEGVDFE